MKEIKALMRPASYAALWLIGNGIVVFAMYHLINANPQLVPLIPWAFLIVPIVIGVTGYKSRSFRLDTSTGELCVFVLLLSIVTWLYVVYMYVRNIYPEWL